MNYIRSVLRDAVCSESWKPVLYFFASMTMLDIFVWASIYQLVGVVPSTEYFSIPLVGKWQLPFPVSRLWDIALGPLCFLIFTWATSRDFFYERENDSFSVMQPEMSFAENLLLLGLTIAMIAGMGVGAVYAPLAFALVYVGFVVVLIGAVFYCMGQIVKEIIFPSSIGD